MIVWSVAKAARGLKYLLLVASLCAASGCQSEPKAGEGQGGPAGGGPNAEASISGETLRIAPVTWPQVARVQGSLFADEVSIIASKVAGRIVEVNCDLGDAVQRGHTLIKLDDTEYALRVVQAEAQLAQARAAIGLKTGDPVSQLDPLRSPPVRETRALLDEARQNVARLQTLFAQGAIVATDLEAALSAEQVADARFNSSLNSVREKIALVEVQAAQLDLAKQQLADTVITAPFDGVVLNRQVAIGTYLQIGQAVVELAKTNVLRFRASVPERFAQQLRIGQRVRLFIGAETRESTVERISPALDPLSRSLVFEAVVPNSENTLRSGLFAQSEIILDEDATAIAIPTSALVRFAGVDKVWRVVDGQVSEAVLQIGREAEGMIEVYEGLSVGDQILVNGASGRVGKYIGTQPQPPPAQELVATKAVAHETKVKSKPTAANTRSGGDSSDAPGAAPDGEAAAVTDPEKAASRPRQTQ